ncbi:hypothetical protein WN944_002740 [Citrus x changshan-huyou]|uniref:Uncharacterized protein n=1 Tax=Citrus x changshan-huyou TaxID=2935761 RepID=A0AAP0QSP6_9ROSI
MAASILLPFTLYIEGNVVLGNTKTALVAVVSVLIFRNPVIVIGMTELAITVMVMVCYSEAKKRFKVPTH